ncbi:hypothetical protein BU24DRAFT_145121 [Aaosphaeria arxii CBS 175.79]|uniref:Uncharacterized protein n=1 Tax=Aaosphaeria arxii CBS 175.79 TaxID=1450172 RepID=A0A6A5XW58_9PLEO|nr:uncharacterized protein BU24DRAFT_145121 [Aaosphaeria arxii CBS 175.79]KAF2017176.1 hypothetical protein BU24DRAFT_145121 [Aaosphaeria arxii CBS 175.79]
MEVLDAYYNGTFNVTLTPPSENSTYLECPELHSQIIPNAFLRIGPQSRNNVTRDVYGDENSFYFHFGRTLRDAKCPLTANKAFVNFESSNDELHKSQGWKLQQTKINGNEFELQGEFLSTVAQYNNYWNYVVNNTGTDQGYPLGCPHQFSMTTLSAKVKPRMSASVSVEEARMEFSFMDSNNGYLISGSFQGKHWTEGPKILFDKETIQTEGEVPHVKPRAPEKSWWDKYGKYIIIGGCILGILVLVYILWHFFTCLFACLQCIFCCSCCKGNGRAARKARKQQEKEKDLEVGSSLAYKHPRSVVTPVLEQDDRYAAATTNISYQVTPVVAESYAVSNGLGHVEIVNAQEELHKAHIDMRNARLRSDQDGIMFAQTMIEHWTSVIEHLMEARRARF